MQIWAGLVPPGAGYTRGPRVKKRTPWGKILAPARHIFDLRPRTRQYAIVIAIVTAVRAIVIAPRNSYDMLNFLDFHYCNSYGSTQ